MTRLLKQYLILAVITQYLVASFLDLGGFIAIKFYSGTHFGISQYSLCFLFLRHWAFFLPITATFITAFVWRRHCEDKVLLHACCGFFLLAITMTIAGVFGFVWPLFFNPHEM